MEAERSILVDFELRPQVHSEIKKLHDGGLDDDESIF